MSDWQTSLAGQDFFYKVENYCKWENGRCVGHGSLYSDIIGKVSGNTIILQLSEVGNTDLPEEIICSLTSYSTNNATIEYMAEAGTVRQCVLASDNNGGLSFIRMLFRGRDSCVELFGQLQKSEPVVSLPPRPKGMRRLPSLKDAFRSPMKEEYQKRLKGNMASMAIIDVQTSLIAFSVRAYLKHIDREEVLLPDEDVTDEEMRQHIFSDAQSLMFSEICPYMRGTFLDGVMNDAREWYDNITKCVTWRTREFVSAYYAALNAEGYVDSGWFVVRYLQ